MNLRGPTATTAALLFVTVLLVVVVSTSVRPRHLSEPRAGDPAPSGEVRGETRTRRAPRERAAAPTPTATPTRTATAEPAPTSEPASPTAATTTDEPATSSQPLSPTAAVPTEDPAPSSEPVETPAPTGGVPVPDVEPASGAAPRGIAAPSPQAVVTRFYAALDDRRFAAAWRTLSPAVQTSFGSFGGWRDGYAATLSSRPSEIRVSPAPGGATVEHLLAAVDRSSCGPVSRRFAVKWRLARVDGAWLAESLSATKRAGAEPAAACT